MGTVNNRPVLLSPDWYQVSGVQTLGGVGTNVTFDMSSLIQLVSNSSKNGYRASIHSIAAVIRYEGTYNATANVSVADIQRLCFFNMGLDTPNYLAKFAVRDQPLSWHRLVGRFVNPLVVSLDRQHPYKRTEYQRMDAYAIFGAAANSLTVNDVSVDKRPSLIDGIGDDENYQPVATAAGGDFVFADIVSMPLTCFSGGANPLTRDKIPLTMVSDPNAPWRVTISENSVGGNTIRADVFKTTALTIKVELWVYVSFARVDGPQAVGTLWSSAPQPFDNSNKVLDAHYYRFLGMIPDLASSTKDNGTAVPYLPDDWSGFLNNGNARILSCSEQVLPLLQYSEAWRFLGIFNLGNVAGANPFLTYDQKFQSDTRYKSSGSGLAGGVVNGGLSATVRGYATNLPYFPIIANQFAVAGFPPGIMAKPGCTADLRAQFDSASLPNGAPSRNLGVYISEYDADRATAIAYSMTGKQDLTRANMDAWKPALDSLTAGSDAVKDIVPWTMSP